MSLTALQASAYLHHLHFYTPAPERLSKWYAIAMNMEVESLSGDLWLTTGPSRLVLFSKGEAKKLSHAGFAVRDAESLQGLRERAEQRGLTPRSVETPLFQPGAFGVTDPDGNAIYFGLAPFFLGYFHRPHRFGNIVRSIVELTEFSTSLGQI